MDRRHFLKSLAVFGSGLALPYPVRRWLVNGTQTFTIPPTIQHVTENSAVLYFRLSQFTDQGVVRVWQGENMVAEIPFVADPLRQQVNMEGLTPANEYRYEVLTDGATPPLHGVDPAITWSPLSFRTPPYEWPVKVVAVGDSGFGDTTTLQLADLMTPLEPDLFFHLGDIVYWMHQHNNDHFLNWLLKYFIPFQGMLTRAPHYPTYGNHDQDGPTLLDGWPSYYWIFPPFNEHQDEEGRRDYYSMDFNGIQFISLNSQLFFTSHARRNVQNDWLDAQLARTDSLYKVIFFHVPLYTSAAPHQWDGIYAEEFWAHRFEEAGVKLVISGHAHVYERLLKNGVNYVIGGGGSGTIYGQGERLQSSQTFRAVSSFPYFEFYEDRIHLTAYDLNGEVIEDLDLPMG